MFKKLRQSFGGGQSRMKMRLDVTIVSASGLPEGTVTARVMWSRDKKLLITKHSNVKDGEWLHVEPRSQHRIPAAESTALRVRHLCMVS
jgi:hypothetical protein